MVGLSWLQCLAAHTLLIRVIQVLGPAITVAEARFISQACNVLAAEAGSQTTPPPNSLAHSPNVVFDTCNLFFHPFIIRND